MSQTEAEYIKDSGYKSRKFIITLISIINISVMGLVFALFGFEAGIFSTIATSIVTVAVGYCGISATRAAIPRYAQNKRIQQTKNRPTHIPKEDFSGDIEEL